MVRHRILIPAFVGSIPTSPAKYTSALKGGHDKRASQAARFLFCDLLTVARLTDTRGLKVAWGSKWHMTA